MKSIDLMYSHLQSKLIKKNLIQKIQEIINRGSFIQGPEVAELENRISTYCNAKYAISCANGTDAITLALMAFDLKPQEVVFIPSFTFVATAEAVCLRGGIPYFVDSQNSSFNICIESLEESIKAAKKKKLKIRGIISVDLFGQPAQYDELKAIAKKYNLFFIADSAQAFGSTYRKCKIGSGKLADITTTSFFPTKPLGCYGDGGMIFTNNTEKASILKSICFHGKGQDKYHNIRIGTNSRLDTIQAAVLLEKLTIFDNEIKKRQNLASYYNKKLKNLLTTPTNIESTESVWAVYTLMHPKRDAIIKKLNEHNIPSNSYYRTPLHLQSAYNFYPKAASIKNSENYASKVFCLPMHAYISDKQKHYIIKTLKKAVKEV